jgi:hypothetical protein
MENQNQLSVTDLAVIKNIIDLACSRGAFRGNEMRQVGEVYDKLNMFINDLIALAENQQSGSVQSQGEAKNA